VAIEYAPPGQKYGVVHISLGKKDLLGIRILPQPRN
jgi:hypothetical protein